MNPDWKPYPLKLYFATGSRMYLYFLLTMGVKNVLISFAYPEPWKSKKVLENHGIKVLCDSGAFTAWSLSQNVRDKEILKYLEGENLDIKTVPKETLEVIEKKVDDKGLWKQHLVNIDNYITFVKENESIINRIVNLDVIPGRKGHIPTKEEREQSAEEGWKNLEYMWSKGIKPVHVFHQGESLRWLDQMINEPECDYIGISPSNDYRDDMKEKWLDHCFRRIMAKRPDLKTHGFGVTSYRIISHFPWYSVDSSSYSLTASFGSIITPYGRVYCSDQHKNDPDHIERKPLLVQNHIDNYLKEIGLSLRGVTTDEIIKTESQTIKFGSYMNRNLANIHYYLEIEKKIRMNGPHMAFDKQQVLFDLDEFSDERG